jgi:hypothetical protein
MKKELELELKKKGFPPHTTVPKVTGMRVFKFSDVAHRAGDMSGEIWIKENYLAEHGNALKITIEFEK